MEVAPASASVSGNGASEVLHTVNIPPGETWLVAVVGAGSTSASGSYLPQIRIGDAATPQNSGHFAAAAIMSESGDVVFISLSGGSSSFTGHVYTVKM
ncbi:hypothetical protein [Pasteurella phage PMP-GADVASU-IND]|nr:hypothetical protein [Pasteurella phage PMP-GADVASU-IND]